MAKTTKPLATLLAKALTQLDAQRDLDALDTTLAAWRACRHPRLADVIDRVSERVGGAAVAGKSVKERTARWLELAKRKRAQDLGPLLATPWPGTWQPAVTVLDALSRFDDPRLAMALCRLVEATRYDTYTSHRFYGPLLAKVQKLGDLRVLPLLETDLQRVKSSYWRQGTRLTMERVVAALKKKSAPTLTKADEQALAALEAKFTGSVSASKAAKKTETALLAEIYAAPEDDAPRAVYADWLSEQNDPRGEFILLQLANARGGASEVAQKRERALLKKHGKAWLGQLDRVLEKDGREFRRGFLARGVIDLEVSARGPGPELRDLAWNTIETIGLSWSSARHFGKDLIALPWFKKLRAVRAFPEDLLVLLAKDGPWPALRELDLSLDDEVDERARSAVWASGAFPNVRRVAFERGFDALAAVLDEPLGRQLTSLVFVAGEDQLGQVVSLADPRPHLDEVGLVGHYRDRRSVWRFTLCRDARGHFTRLLAEPDVDASSCPEGSALAEALASVAALTEVTVRSPFPCDFPPHDATAVSEALARFPDAKLDVPWPTPAPS